MPTNPIPPLSPKAYFKADTGTFQDTAGTTPAVANGDPIARWEDQSGNGYHLTQATAGNRPTLRASAFKGLPAVNFDDGFGQFLSNSVFPWTQSKASGAWVIALQADDGLPNSGLVATAFDQLSILCMDQTFTAYKTSYDDQRGVAYLPSRQGLVLSLVYDGSGATNADRLKLYRNYTSMPLTFPGASILSTTYAGSPGMWLGRGSVGGPFRGRINSAAFFSSLADSDRIAIIDYLGATCFSHTAHQALFTGDSRTKGFNGSTHYNDALPLTGSDSYPVQVESLLGASWSHINGAVDGTYWAQWITGTANVDRYQDDWSVNQFVTAFGGVNDFGAGRTTAQVQADITTWITQRKNAGFIYIYLGTEIGSIEANETDAFRNTINAWIRANVPGIGARVVDFQADSRLANAAASSNTTYYLTDRVHLASAGNAVLASILVPVVRLDFPPPNVGNARSFPRGLIRGLTRGVV